MPHLIPTAVNEQLQSSSNDWSGIDLPVYKSCFDQYGFGDWSVLQEESSTSHIGYSAAKSGTVANLTLLNVPETKTARQRADIFIANTGCTSIDYEIGISGVIETFNGPSFQAPEGYDQLRISRDGNALDLAGLTLTHNDPKYQGIHSDPNYQNNRVFIYPVNSFVVHSQFNDQDINDWGSVVSMSPKTITIDPSPCPTQLTFWADTVDPSHNTIQPNTSQPTNVKYDITITKK